MTYKNLYNLYPSISYRDIEYNRYGSEEYRIIEYLTNIEMKWEYIILNGNIYPKFIYDMFYERGILNYKESTYKYLNNIIRANRFQCEDEYVYDNRVISNKVRDLKNRYYKVRSVLGGLGMLSGDSFFWLNYIIGRFRTEL